jgi:outer membrane protein, adhesin transport system
MKKQFIFWIFLSVILSANEELVSENTNQNISVYLDEKQSDKEISQMNSNGRYDKDFNTDISKYKKVSLMDVVLETVSNSALLKASREQVIQSEIKLKDAIAGYYPTFGFESQTGRTQSASKSNDYYFKYYNDRNYKLIFNQNIYSGGETTNNVKSLEKELNVAKNKYNLVLQEEITKAIKAYFDVVFAYRTVLASENNMKNLNRILEIVTIKYDNGAATIGDLTAIKANVSNAQTALTKVRSKLVESIRYYEYIVGNNYVETLPYEKNFNINVSTFDLLYERGLKRNRTILNYYESIESEKYNLKSKESTFSPKLDFEVSVDNIMEQEDATTREKDFNALIKLTYNFYNGGRDKNKILTSFSAIRELNFKLDEEKKKLKWNISKLFTSIKSTNESLKSNISEVISLRKMVEAYWDEFNLGQQDLQSLLQGHKQLNAAEIELIKYESGNITDFFTLLGYTGDLLVFFDMDPEHSKFIDFSKSNYTQNVYIDDKFLTEKEKIEREEEQKKDEELKNSLAGKAIKDENINNFIKSFLLANDDFYTIEMGTFNNQEDATAFIKANNLDTSSFAYSTVNNFILNSKIIHGIYQNADIAKIEMNKLSKANSQKSLVLKKVNDAKQAYNDYIAGLKVKAPPVEIKIVEKTNTIEKIKQEKKPEVFQFNEAIKLDFLNANLESYTINITSLNDKKELEKILIENASLYDNSYEFDYFNGTQLIRWNYGIYKTYDEAQSVIQSLGDKGVLFYPTVQKVSKELELYNSNILPTKQIEPEKKVEFEYIDVSSKTEYKEAVPLKDYVQVKEKPIENKIQNLMKSLDQQNVIEKINVPVENKVEEKAVSIESNSKQVEIADDIKKEKKSNPIGGESKPNKFIDDEVRIIPSSELK